MTTLHVIANHPVGRHGAYLNVISRSTVASKLLASTGGERFDPASARSSADRLTCLAGVLLHERQATDPRLPERPGLGEPAN